MYISVCMCVLFECKYVCVCMHVCICPSVCVHMYISVHVCICLNASICVCVCMCVYVYTGVDLTVTINDIHLCGTPIIACFCSYHNMLLQQRVINHKVKLYMQATCKRLNVTSF